MKKGLTDLVFILDRSGSMSGLEADTVGGFNAMLGEQKRAAGGALLDGAVQQRKRGAPRPRSH